MKPCRPSNSPLASAKPSCNSPRQVRKRSNNCDCYSEKQVDRASGKAFALPGYGGLRRSGRTSVQDSLRLKNRLFFFRAEKLSLYQQIDRRSRARTDPFRLILTFMGVQTDTLQWRHISCSLYIYYGASDRSGNFGTRSRSSYERACWIGDFRFVFVFVFSGLYTKLKNNTVLLIQYCSYHLPPKTVPYCSYPINTKINNSTTVPLYMTSTYNSKTAVQYRMTPIYNSTLTTSTVPYIHRSAPISHTCLTALRSTSLREICTVHQVPP